MCTHMHLTHIFTLSICHAHATHTLYIIRIVSSYGMATHTQQSLIELYCMLSALLNQTRAGCRLAHTWFLEIALVRSHVSMSVCVCGCVCVCVCVCVCPRP